MKFPSFAKFWYVLFSLILPVPFSWAVEVPIPKNCRVEEVQGTLPPGIETAQCQRTICSGNAWGDSAVDVCCQPKERIEGIGDNMIRYLRCWTRHPSRVNANEPWTEMRYLLSSPNPPLHGGELPVDERSAVVPVEWINLAGDYLVQDLFAQEAPPPIPWSPEEKALVAAQAYLIGERIQQALFVSDTNLVGSPDSEYRAYIHLTLQSVLYTACALAPATYPCPPLLSGLHFLVPETGLFWRSQSSIARTENLYQTFVTPDWMVQSREGGTIYPGMVALHGGWLIPHELTHVINWFTGRLEATYDPTSRERLLYRIAWSSFMNEALARIVGALAYTFLTPEELSTIPADRTSTFESRLISDLLRTDPPMARRAWLNRDNNFTYVCSALWTSINALEEFILGVETWFSSFVEGRETPEGEEFAFEACRRWFMEDPGRFLAVLRQFEDQYQAAGGTCSVWEDSGGELIAGEADQIGALLCMSAQPPNDDNCTDSPDCYSPCEPVPDEDGDLSVGPYCEPPDCQTNPDECQETPEEPADSDEEVPECILFYDDYLAEGNAVDSRCYRFCWEHPDDPFCTRPNQDDLRGGCSLSGGNAACTAALPDYCVQNPTGPLCRDLCESNEDYAHCSALCEVDHTPSYCGERCARVIDDLNRTICHRRCIDRHGNSPYCLDLCQDDYNPSYCGEICASGITQENLGFCGHRCTDRHGNSPYCGDVCAMRRYTDCNNFCDNFPNDSFCIDQRARERERAREEDERRAEEEAREEEDGCPSGMDPMYAAAPVAVDGCFPFVGNVCVGGGSSQPNGPQEACRTDGWCGCPENAAFSWSGWCQYPGDVTWIAWGTHVGHLSSRYCYHHCARATLGGIPGCLCVPNVEALASGDCPDYDE